MNKRKDITDLMKKYFGEQWNTLDSLKFFIKLLDHNESVANESVVDDLDCITGEELPHLIV